MKQKNVIITDAQDEFLKTKPDGRRFNLSAFVRAKLDEWIGLCEKEVE